MWISRGQFGRVMWITGVLSTYTAPSRCRMIRIFCLPRARSLMVQSPHLVIVLWQHWIRREEFVGRGMIWVYLPHEETLVYTSQGMCKSKSCPIWIAFEHDGWSDGLWDAFFVASVIMYWPKSACYQSAQNSVAIPKTTGCRFLSLRVGGFWKKSRWLISYMWAANFKKPSVELMGVKASRRLQIGRWRLRRAMPIWNLDWSSLCYTKAG